MSNSNRSSKHDTPEQVAAVLARYAPKKLDRLLDASAGGGALVAPFLKRSRPVDITCVDIDEKAIVQLKRRFALNRVSIIHVDFLQWAAGYTKELFDCVVMNPPFAAKLRDLVRHPGLAFGSEVDFSIPLEFRFVYLALRLLNPGGRLLAVLPASLVSTATGHWLRSHLLTTGAVRLVHELPPRTFKGVEGRIYLLVYEHGARTRSLLLRNHRLYQPDEMRIRAEDEPNLRWDYAYHSALKWFRGIRAKGQLDWTRLSEIASVERGTLSNPKSHDCLHSTNFEASFTSAQAPPSELNGVARGGDIVVKRVGRRCGDSFRRYEGPQNVICSDCVLILKPKRKRDSLHLLFALRVLFASEIGRPLIENGMAASYIATETLTTLEVPMGVYKLFPQDFKRYRRAINRGDYRIAKDLEEEVRIRLIQNSHGDRS